MENWKLENITSSSKSNSKLHKKKKTGGVIFHVLCKQTNTYSEFCVSKVNSDLTIQVELWDGDEEKSRKLSCFFTRPETRGLIFDSYRHTAVTHHSPDPQFYEEIKSHILLCL